MTIETFPLGTYRVGPKDDPDRYCLGQAVGAGAEGTLYRGSLTIDAGLVLEVAIKMLHPHHRPRLAAWQRRWGDQVELLRSVHAPGLVAVRDGFVGALPHLAGDGDNADTLYLVMNFIDGLPIDAWAGDHPDMADRDKLRLLLPIAAGLDLMHSGAATGGTPVIHGDVKPGNILVTDDGATILVDFGMMRSLPGGVRQTSIAGTANYIAPEVAIDGLYTPAADRYSFGGVAYYLLTGRHPTSDHAAMRLALEEGGRDAEVVDHVLRMFLPAELRPASLANWCAQLRDSSLDIGAELGTLPPPAPIPPMVPGAPASPVPADRPATGEPTQDRPPGSADLLETTFSRAPTLPGLPPAGVDSQPAPATGRRQRWRWVAATALVTIVVAAAVIWTRSPAASVPTAHYAFAPSMYPDGLVVTRDWSLTGPRADRLHTLLRVTNGSDVAVTGTVDEVITKSIASRVTEIRFLPDPDLIVRTDPVVQYAIHGLQPRHAVDFVYNIAVPRGRADMSRLEGWAAAETEEEAAYRRETPGSAPSTLILLAVNPPSLSLEVGQSYQLSPSGGMSDGQAASAFVLGGLVWGSGDLSTVGVDDGGRITANRPGTAKVTAQAGTLRAEVTVTVPSTRSSPSQINAAPPVSFEPPTVTVDPPNPVRAGPTPRTATPETTTPEATTPGATTGTTTPGTITPPTTTLAPQAIAFRDPGVGVVGTTATLSAAGGPSGRPVGFSVGNPGAGVCSLSGATVTYILAGSCVINADQAGDVRYAAAPRVTRTIVVRPGSQVITFTAPVGGVVGTPVVLSATGGLSVRPVVFSVDSASGAGVCAVSGVNGTTLTFTAAGSCVVDADQAGGLNYDPAPRVSRSIPVTDAGGRVPLKVDDTVVSGPNFFRYTGAWIPTTGNAGRYLGTGHYIEVKDASFTFTFTGTQASWWGGQGPNQGWADVSVDGVLQKTVDTYRSVHLDNVEIFRTQTLDPAVSHTMTVRVTGMHNPASGGFTISVDYGAVLPPP